MYDGWNLIQKQTTAGATTTTEYYVWGLDLSGTLQGAGGIGGLLTKTNSLTSKTYLYTFDANGNVGQLVDAADGSLAAAYEYDPFGKLLVSTGSETDNNAFRFSTKYYDVETGLYDYGRRYYSPELGRWQTRDPIREKGGLNLYGFVENNPINRIDPLGLIIVIESGETDILARLNFLWPDGGPYEIIDGVVQGNGCGCTSDDVSKEPEVSCQCICGAIHDEGRVYTIRVVKEGTVPIEDFLLADGTRVTLPYPQPFPNTTDATGSNPLITIPPSAEATYIYGFFDSEGGHYDAPAWRILAHELCGHAWARLDYLEEDDPPDQDAGYRPGHDKTIQIENQIARERGINIMRELFNSSKQGESTFQLMGEAVYYYPQKDGWHKGP